MKKVLIFLLLIGIMHAGTVTSVEDNPYALGYVEGYIKQIIPEVPEIGQRARLIIESYQGSIYDFNLTNNYLITIDQRIMKLSDLHKNMEVYAILEGRQLATIEAFSTVKMGYIQPGRLMEAGVITAIDINSIEIRKADGNLSRYNWSFLMPITKKGRAINGDQLYIGDRAKLYFDELDSSTVSRVEVEGDSALVKDIYRGTLEAIGFNDQQLTLRNVEVLRDNNWQNHQAAQRIAFNNDLAVYVGGIKIANNNLKYYNGKDVYMVTKNIMGQERIDRLLIQSLRASNDSAKIEEVNWFNRIFELSNSRNFSFNDASIVIKDGRIQDINTLAPGMSAFVVSDGNSENRLAYIVNVYDNGVASTAISEDRVYAGTLSQAFEDWIWLEDPYVLADNSWHSEGEKELFLDSNTYVYDSEARKSITTKELSSSYYSINEDSEWAEEHNLYKWFVYVYCKGDTVAAILLQKDDSWMEEQRITTASVVSAEEDSLVGWVANLNDCRDWSERRQEWMPRNSQLRVGLEDAMIIQNNKIIRPDELRPGSRLYITRDDFHARVVLVK